MLERRSTRARENAKERGDFTDIVWPLRILLALNRYIFIMTPAGLSGLFHSTQLLILRTTGEHVVTERDRFVFGVASCGTSFELVNAP